MDGDPDPCLPVPVRGENREIIGWSLFSPASRIAVRMISFTATRPAADWLEQRLERCLDLRTSLCLASNAFRLIHPEGEYLKGWLLYAE